MDEAKKQCKACRELILSDASVCPHCRTEQNRQFHKSVLVGLKELSAVTVIFSLIFAVAELNRFADSWFANADYADRLADSAALLLKTGDFSGARKILAEARELSPSSEKVGNGLKALSMASIRNKPVPRTEDDVQEFKDSLLTLYQNLGSSDKSDAEILAHIAWGSYRLRGKGYSSIDVNAYLDKALSLDKNSAYANAYKGFWYLQIYKNKDGGKQLSENELLKKAKYHINVAIQQNSNPDYIYDISLEALSGIIYKVSAERGHEYVKLVANLRLKNSASVVDNFNQLRDTVISHLYNSYGENQERFSKIFMTLSEKEFASIVELLDKVPESKNNETAYYNKDFGKGYAHVLQAEYDFKHRRFQSAVRHYSKAYAIFVNTSKVVKRYLPDSIASACKKIRGTTSEMNTWCDDFL